MTNNQQLDTGISGWHVGYYRSELAAELTRRFGWGKGWHGKPLVEFNTLTNDQMADVLNVLDERDELAGVLVEATE